MESITDTEVHAGQVLGGKFRIEQVLGRGGMGVVVAATHLQLDEKVALKFLLPEALVNKEAVRRFEREARSAVKIKSEHVARVTDVGTLDTGAPYMVMEFLNGMDLGEYLERTGPLPFHEAADYLLQACEAIAEAHALGIVHRDLKPANLFRIIRSDGTPSIKVLDFGISKVTTGADAAMTQTTSMMGSPYYMSPEQMTSAKSVDERTDIWALGIILHELLSGKVPYQGETIPEICVQVLQNPPPRLSLVRPEAPEDLERIIDKALAKNRDHRYLSVAEFAADISAYATSASSHSVERISKVLGVAASARPSIADLAYAAGLGRAGASTIASTHGKVPALASATQESEGLSATTLGGAAHEQPEYKPPTSSSKLPLFVGIAAVFLGAAAFVFMSGNKTDSATELDPVVANEGPTNTVKEESPNDPKTEAKQPQEEEKQDDSAEDPTDEPAASAEPDEEPAPPPPVTPPRPKPVARPGPRPAPPPEPVVAPAPRPTPRPKPNTTSLYQDRK
jgi:serine/threonine-protein kinase